jgi:glycosyltransferase involved in cell wall biosynthesis
MLKRKTILYVGNFHFPKGNAAGKRVYGNSILLKELGYSVTVIDTTSSYKPINYELSTKTYNQGFEYYSLPYPRGLKDWLKFYKAYRAVKDVVIRKQCENDIFAVIMYGSPTLSLFNLFLIKYCKSQNIKIVADCVDWLSIKSKSVLFNIIKSLDDYCQKAIFNKKVDGVICISEFLSDYYRSSGKKTTVIPPLSIELDDDKKVHKAPEIQTFIYAGRPFRDDMVKDDVHSMKDRVDIIFNVFKDLKCEGYNFKLHVFGFEVEEFLRCVPSMRANIELIMCSTTFHGHADNNIVLDTLKESSFSILFRDCKRDTIAGFPTKVAESIAVGTPVIVSNVGDISKYVVEGINGFLSPVDDYNMQLNSVRKALEASSDKVKEMKSNSLNDTSFSTCRYKSSTYDFFASL